MVRKREGNERGDKEWRAGKREEGREEGGRERKALFTEVPWHYEEASYGIVRTHTPLQPKKGATSCDTWPGLGRKPECSVSLDGVGVGCRGRRPSWLLSGYMVLLYWGEVLYTVL